VGRRGYRFIAPIELISAPAVALPTIEEIAVPSSSLPQTGAASPLPAAEHLRPRRFWPYVAVLAAGLSAGVAIVRWSGASPVLKPLLRLTLDLEPGTLRAETGAGLALAPDGARIAAAVRSDDGKVRLAIRRLDQDRPALLTGTEGAGSPFFSPD